MKSARYIIAILLAALMLLPPRFCCAAMTCIGSADSQVSLHLPCCPDLGDEGEEDSAPRKSDGRCHCGCCLERFVGDQQPTLGFESGDSLFVTAPTRFVTLMLRDVLAGVVAGPPRPHPVSAQIMFCRWNC